MGDGQPITGLPKSGGGKAARGWAILARRSLPPQAARADFCGHLRARLTMGTANRPHTPNQRLGSWKEIAAFFDCDERTVRRWEKERGLPVHRTPGAAGGKVFAYADELSAWLVASREAKTEGQPVPFPWPRSETPAADFPIAGRPALVEKPAGGRPLFRYGWRTAALALFAILVAGAGSVAFFDHHPGPDSIAVLPFANASADPATDYLSDGITESLINNLARVPQLKVRSRNSVFRYKGKDVDLRTAGTELAVSALVTGRVLPRGDDIEVSAELTDARDNVEIWGQHYTGKRADLISLQQQIAGEIAEKVRAKLSSSEKQQVIRQDTQNPDAYDLYLKGRYAWNQRSYRDLNAAIFDFNQAIAKDPSYALAYSGIADAYAVLPNFGGNPSEDYPRSNAAARKALELDASLAHPHAVLGENEMQYDWDFAGGEAEFKRAFELDPNDATARQWYADDIAMMGGREHEALMEINRALQIEPSSPVINRVYGGILVSAHQYDQAIAVCSKLANENATFAIAHDCLAYAYWGKGMYPEVIEEWKTYGKITGDRSDVEWGETLEQGFRSAGWQGAMTRAAELSEARRKTGYESPLMIARLYANLGDKERTFRWLDTAYREHDWLLIGLNTYFQFDSVRADPRFAELVRKVGLPQ